MALFRQGRIAEAETQLRKAMELDPKYVFAPCTLSLLYLREERVAEARALLDKVTLPGRVHPEAMAAYCLAQAQVAAAEEDGEKAFGWLDTAGKVAPHDRNVKELRKRLRIPRLGALSKRAWARVRRGPGSSPAQSKLRVTKSEI